MIQIKNLKKSFGSKQVLNGVNLEIHKGKIHGLIGSNGAGKSTLINVISGLIKSDSGDVLINGNSIENKYAYKTSVGYVFETPLYLEKLSAKEYLAFVSRSYNLHMGISSKKINELLDFFDLPRDNKKYIDQYSRGMKVKVSIAAAIIHDPIYLVLDEPFVGLDFHSIDKVSKLLKDKANNGGAIIVASHQHEIIPEICDRLVLLDQGKICLDKKINELGGDTKINLKSIIKGYINSK